MDNIKVYNLAAAYPFGLKEGEDVSTTYESDLAWLNQQIKLIGNKHDKHSDEVFVDLSMMD